MVYYTYTVTRGGGRPIGAARWHAGSLTRTLSRTSAFARTFAWVERGCAARADDYLLRPHCRRLTVAHISSCSLHPRLFFASWFTHFPSSASASSPSNTLAARFTVSTVHPFDRSLPLFLPLYKPWSGRRPSSPRYTCRTPHAARLTPRLIAARRTAARPPNISPLPLLHAVHRPPCAACRQSLVTLCPPPASRAHHLDEPNSTDRACPVTALAPLPRPSRATLNRLGSIRATPRWVASRHAASDRIVPRRLRDHAAPCWLVPCQHRQRAITSPTSLSLSLHSSHCHLSSATRRNFLRHGVILVYIQSHAHDLLPLPLPSPPFRLHGDNQARKNEWKTEQKYIKRKKKRKGKVRREIVRIVGTDRQMNKRRLKIIVGSNKNISNFSNFLFLDAQESL